MPIEPKGQKRPTDVIGSTVHVMRIAKGELEEIAPENDGKDPVAKSLGARGGAARAKSMTPERRTQIAKMAAEKRWKKTDA